MDFLEKKYVLIQVVKALGLAHYKLQTLPCSPNGCGVSTRKETHFGRRGFILKGMSYPLFDIYQNIESRKELWDSFEAKYMAEDASSNKFLEELTLVELGSHLRIEESLRVQDSDKPKSKNVAGPQTESRVLGAVVRLPDPKLKTLGERGNKCIFVGYVEHSNAFRFYVIEPNDLVLINSIIESRDAIFDENRFSSVPRPSLRIPNGTEDIGEAINDEMDSIMGNNTWVLADLPPGCKPLGCKWIFKRKLKVDGTIEKFKARLVIQGFKQKSGVDYFDTYAPVARISTIRLLITMASIHNLIIYQMDVKTAFLNGDLDEEVYMNQPQGFIMPGNENKVCKLIKSLYGLKQAPKKWHQKFDKVVLSNGYLLNQAEKCVYSKFDKTGKGVIICLYVDDMLIFGTDQVQVDLTKEFLSSRFSMKDMGEADVILGIRIKHKSNRIAISQSHYIGKVLKKFNYFNCTPVSTPMDKSEKLMPNNGQVVSQLEYSRVFLFGGGVISRASKKQTCITGSIMEYEFMALAAAGKEVKWLKNLLLEILLWSKPIAHISIRCDSIATLPKAYNQMYNGKSRHLGVRHSMISELITNGVISIEFVRSQQNLADHLTKGLARDLVIKSAEGMGLKGLKHMYLHIISRMCLEPAEKEDEAMAKEDAFLVDDVEGGLCVDNTDARIDGRFNSGSNKDKGKVGE
ncbi:zinc finger, CCHC-type containing protein [Tanacetum coccineum]